MSAETANDWSFACYSGDGPNGDVSVVSFSAGHFRVRRLGKAAATGLEEPYRPLFLAVDDQSRAVLMDPLSKHVSRTYSPPEDVFPVYAYRDADKSLNWYTNDGDENGNDIVHCAGEGASVMVMGGHAGGIKLQATLCVGRGHHTITFVGPTAQQSQIPQRAFICSLNDGSLSVVGYDPADTSTYLQVLNTLNLADAKLEQSGEATVPNKAFPHGMVFSSLSGKVYCLCNGYEYVLVIDPITLAVEKTIAMPVSSNLLISACGRYVIGKGADRKGNAEHVIGRLSVLDVTTGSVVRVLDVPDVYLSCYRFSSDGKKLYVTSASTGKGKQKENLRMNVLQIYDATCLPELVLQKEVKVGTADCGRRPLAFRRLGAVTPYVLVPNHTDGTLTVLDGETDVVIDTLTVGAKNVTEFSFCYWEEHLYGA